MLRNILLGLGVFAALFAVLIFSGKIPIGNSGSQAKGEVVLWGTIPEEKISQIIQQFNPKAKDYTVFYKEIPEAQFSKTLLEALASGQGPDLIIAPHQLVLSNASRLYPFPTATMSEKSFKSTYVDGASVLWTPQGALALPVSIDPLVLFYNRGLFSKHGIVNPPTYWDEVVTMIPALTIPNNNGGFVESAIALGAPNVAYVKDIVMATVGQLGQLPVMTTYQTDGTVYREVSANKPIMEQGEVLPLATTVRFFSQFADPSKSTYTWSQFGGNADDQFVAERLAMYIGYASELDTLRNRNLKADFDISTLPQTRGYNTFVTGGQMYAIGAIKNSKNLITALTVESQFAGSGIAPALANILGTVPALRSYAGVQGVPEVVAKSMLVAKPWLDSFPVESTNYVASMLSDIINGRMGPTDAAATFVSRLQDLYTPI